MSPEYLAPPVPRLITVGALADQHQVKVHVIGHLIRRLNLRPIGRAGVAFVYADADADRIADALASRRTRRDTDH